MSNEQAQRTRQMHAHISAAVMFVLLLGTGFMISPSAESALDPAPATAALTPSFNDAEQWTGAEEMNQRTGYEGVVDRVRTAEEHIQAF